MKRRLTLTLAMLCGAVAVMANGQTHAQEGTTALTAGLTDYVRHAAAFPPPSDASLLHVQGGTDSIRLDVRRTTVAQVLAALIANYEIAYHASIPLDREIDGTYTGSLPRIIDRVLRGYNFAIERQDAKLIVVIFDKGGDQAIAAPRQHPVSEHRATLARAAAETH
jgi:hypothetical protein